MQKVASGRLNVAPHSNNSPDGFFAIDFFLFQHVLNKHHLRRKNSLTKLTMKADFKIFELQVKIFITVGFVPVATTQSINMSLFTRE